MLVSQIPPRDSPKLDLPSLHVDLVAIGRGISRCQAVFRTSEP